MSTRMVRRRSTCVAIAVALSVVGIVACRSNPDAAKQQYLANGDRFAAEGKYGEAIVEYRNAIKADGKSGEARFKLAEAMAKVGDAQRAYREYIRAADLLPANVEAQVKAGTMLLLAGQFEDAKARAQKALAVDARSLDAQILLANATAGLKDIDGAVQQIEEAIKLDPAQGKGYTSLGALQLVKGNRAEAEAAFARAVEVDPKSVPARLALANFYWSSGRQAEAETSLQQALQMEPDNAIANRALATFYLSSNRAPEAEPFLKRVAERADTPAPKLQLAEYYAGTNRVPEAIQVLTPLLSDARVGSAATVRLAALEYGEGKKTDAKARLDALVAKEATNAEALVLRGRFRLAENDLDGAVVEFQAAAKADPQNIAAHYALGTIHASRNRNDEATAAFQEVLKLNPRAVPAQLQLSRLALQGGDVARSTQYSSDALKAAPGNPIARLLFARSLIAKGDLARAESEMASLRTEFPSAPQVLSQYGTLLLAKRDLPGARAAFEKAIAQDPRSLEALAGLSAVDIGSNRIPDARKRIDAAIAATPRNAQLLVLGARVAMTGKDAAGAEAYLRKAVEADPNQLAAYGLLGQLFIAQRRLDEARSEFLTLAGKSSKATAPKTMVGIIEQAQGRNDEAMKLYRDVMAADPRAAVAANNLAWLMAERGENLDQALEYARVAKEQLAETSEVDDTLGWIYFKKQMYTQAVSSFTAAVEREPRNPDYQLRLGLAHAKGGDLAKARSALQEALRLRPDFAGNDEARKTLKAIGG